MKFFDYIRLAFKNIGRQKLRSALTIFAVVIGATSVTIMLALVNGAKDFFVAQFEKTGQLQQVVVTEATDLNYQEAQGGGPGGPAPVAQQGQGATAAPTPKLSDALVTKIKDLAHVVNLTPTTGVGFDSLLYQGQRLRIEGSQAYEPNGTIKPELVAGRDLQASDGAGIVTLSTEYADKLGFQQNYGALVGQRITLRTQPYFTGEGATLPAEPTCSGGGPGQVPPPQVPPQQVPGQGQAPGQGPPPASGPGGGGCPQGGQLQKENSQPTDLSATVVGVVGSGSHQGATINFPLSWARGLLENRQWGQTPADQQAFNQQQQAFQQAQQACHTPGHFCNPQPQPPRPHITLITQNQLDQQGYRTIVVQADSATDADLVAAAIRPLGVGAVSAQSYIKQQESAFNILALVLGGIGAIALAVAAIGVINTMVMAILERTREIGVLRACGATRATVRRLFTFEAAMLGFWGGVFGIVVGYALTLVANSVINNQLKVHSISETNIITLPIWLIVAVVCATTLIGVLAGLYPASRAARLNPVEALRYE